MKKHKIKLVVTDFDNTLYDWFEGWYAYFSIVLDNISILSGVEKEKIKVEIRRVHQKYGTSEYSHLLDELNTIFINSSLTKDIDTYTKILKDAFLARNNVLHLYDTVLESLISIKKSGARIAVYTESQPLYSEDRLVKLGLDGLIDTLYAPLTRFPIEHSTSLYDNLDFSNRGKSKYTKIKNLPSEDTKPNPKVLLDIISDFNILHDEVIYIGDSKVKDICMANSAGIVSILVNFGVSSHLNAYNLLRDVSHWTNEDIQREKESSKLDCIPTYELHKKFSEIFSFFEFNA